jgi:imidazolonepropionase-like amidohydrolase
VGKRADLIVLDAPDDRHLVYHWGINLVVSVVCNGWVHQP